MDFDIYQMQALRTAKPMEPLDDLLHAALGLTGEAGEFADAVKKHAIYDQPLNLENAEEELGDLLWYVALGCHALGVSMKDIAQRNINKLRVRYPEKYDDELALIRMDKQ